MSTLMATGTVTIEGNHATLTFTRRIPHPIEVVWAALTEPEQRVGGSALPKSTRAPDGTIEMVSEGPPVPPEMRQVTGRILVWDPPHVLEHEWRQVIVGDGVVRYELVADGEATILTFTHRGLTVPDASGFAPGTHAFLDRLEAHLDRSTLPNWVDRYAEVESAYTGANQVGSTSEPDR